MELVACSQRVYLKSTIWPPRSLAREAGERPQRRSKAMPKEGRQRYNLSSAQLAARRLVSQLAGSPFSIVAEVLFALARKREASKLPRPRPRRN